jgi:hypothetical protein
MKAERKTLAGLELKASFSKTQFDSHVCSID